MKKTAFSLLVLLASASGARAQTVPATQVPAAVRATFKAKFPTVKSNTWEREGAAYEAGFRQNGNTMSAVITPAGVWQKTETDMRPAQLPAAVRATLARAYKLARVVAAATLVKADGTTVYEAELSQGGQKRDVLFTADGRVASK